METRVAVISIIVENTESTERLNAILHEYGEYIIGRMGLPYRARGVNIICVAVDAPQDIISALSGKIGRLPGVTGKTAYSNVKGMAEDSLQAR
ncbi:MAG: iron-only hydrogenase system regulator [Lachnospiraceae bacterium]|nr:iron-only hydrogenase system regulator [Lachnospiraceae bacterium]